MTDTSTAPTPPPRKPVILTVARDEIASQLKSLGIEWLTTQVHLDGETQIRIGRPTEHSRNGEAQPLRDTPSLSLQLDGAARHFENLAALVGEYLQAWLAHNRDPYLCDGEISLYQGGHVAPPTNWAAKFADESKVRRQELAASKLPIIAALKARGATVATIRYDGEGDSGQIEAIVAYSAGNGEIDLDVAFVGQKADAQAPNLRDALDQLAWDCLAAFHDGFENNEGGYGEISIDVASGVITIDHNERITEVSNTVTEA